MSKLALLQQSEANNQGASKKTKRVNSASKMEDSLDQFPLPRYFQTHFQFIHQNNCATQNELKQVKQHMQAIEDKLDRLLQAFERVL